MLGCPTEDAGQVLGLHPARRIRPVDHVADLGGRVADRPERVGDGLRVAQRRGVVRHDLEDRVGRVQDRERHVAQGGRQVDHDCLVDATQQGQDLLDVTGADHLGELHAGWREEDVDAGGVTPQHVREVRLADPVGRQVQDGRRVRGHLEERAEIAELEARVHQASLPTLAGQRDREVEGERRPAHAALRGVDRDHRRTARRIGGRGLLVRRVDDVDQLEARERHREDARDPGGGVRLDRALRNREHDEGDRRPDLADELDHATGLGPALEQPVDDHHVRTQLLDLRRRPAAVRDDVDELDGLLGVEEAADILGDLRHVLHEEEANLAGGRRHQGDDTRLKWWSRASGRAGSDGRHAAPASPGHSRRR